MSSYNGKSNTQWYPGCMILVNKEGGGVVWYEELYSCRYVLIRNEIVYVCISMLKVKGECFHITLSVHLTHFYCNTVLSHLQHKDFLYIKQGSSNLPAVGGPDVHNCQSVRTTICCHTVEVLAL